ncbi:UNVERIFIED_CONTAM: protein DETOXIFICATION 8 [Sesamum latifolium]|uniref:Protein DETOXIFICATION n=1 Tax=Sesamum latifolium TaxID=2727402 RepID=A0AAW2X878_9LAMI
MEPEQPLLVHANNVTRKDFAESWEVLSGEAYKVIWLAWPMVVVSVSQYLVQAVPMMMLGHLDELALSSASVATSLSTVTGYSLIFGMACALETLCGQAYGAKHYKKVGTFTYGAIIWLFLACMPVCVLWIYTGRLLILIGQDPVISVEAGKYSIWLIPSLFPYAILQSLVRYLQTQSLILPMLLSTVASLCLHLPLSWALIFKLKLGNAGAALSIGLSYWLNAIMLGLYVKYSSSSFLSTPSFAAVMNCLEWWTVEIIILCGGLLPNPELETSVLSICLTIISMHFGIQYAFGAAASTRVSNELGAGKAQAAQLAVSTVLVLSIVEFVIASTAIFTCRYTLGYLFSNEKDVVYYIKEMTPFVCIFIVFDSLQAVFSGVARGSGWQNVGAYVNLGAYYLVGIPVSLLLGFVLPLQGKGLWCGLIVGAMVQSVLLVIITFRTDWEKQAVEARRRIFEGKLPTRDQLV